MGGSGFAFGRLINVSSLGTFPKRKCGGRGKVQSMFNSRCQTETIEVHALRRHENCYFLLLAYAVSKVAWKMIWIRSTT